MAKRKSRRPIKKRRRPLVPLGKIISLEDYQTGSQGLKDTPIEGQVEEEMDMPTLEGQLQKALLARKYMVCVFWIEEEVDGNVVKYWRVTNNFPMEDIIQAHGKLNEDMEHLRGLSPDEPKPRRKK